MDRVPSYHFLCELQAAFSRANLGDSLNLRSDYLDNWFVLLQECLKAVLKR